MSCNLSCHIHRMDCNISSHKWQGAIARPYQCWGNLPLLTGLLFQCKSADILSCSTGPAYILLYLTSQFLLPLILPLYCSAPTSMLWAPSPLPLLWCPWPTQPSPLEVPSMLASSPMPLTPWMGKAGLPAPSMPSMRSESLLLLVSLLVCGTRAGPVDRHSSISTDINSKYVQIIECRDMKASAGIILAIHISLAFACYCIYFRGYKCRTSILMKPLGKIAIHVLPRPSHGAKFGCTGAILTWLIVPLQSRRRGPQCRSRDSGNHAISASDLQTLHARYNCQFAPWKLPPEDVLQTPILGCKQCWAEEQLRQSNADSVCILLLISVTLPFWLFLTPDSWHPKMPIGWLVLSLMM